MCLDRSGLVGADGPTHHGVFDLAYMRPIPNMVISAPYNEHELRNLMYTAAYGNEGPFVIRYPRGQGEIKDWQNEPKILPLGKGRLLKKGKDIALLSIGVIGNQASKAIDEAEKLGISVAHYDMVFLKPIDEDLLNKVSKKFTHVITVEDGVIKGGLGSAVLEYLSDNDLTNTHVHRIGIGDEFITHGSISELQKIIEIDKDGILKKIIEVYIEKTGAQPSASGSRSTTNPIKLMYNHQTNR